MKSLIVCVGILLCLSATPAAAQVGRFAEADVAILAINSLQYAAVGLHGILRCPDGVPGVPPPDPCPRMLSNANTRIVIEAASVAINAINRGAPTLWAVPVHTLVDELRSRLGDNAQRRLGFWIYLVEVTTFPTFAAPPDPDPDPPL
jgi:hypothetical protein